MQKQKIDITKIIERHRKVKKLEYIKENIQELVALRKASVPYCVIADELERVIGKKVSVTYLRTMISKYAGEVNGKSSL